MKVKIDNLFNDKDKDLWLKIKMNSIDIMQEWNDKLSKLLLSNY